MILNRVKEGKGSFGYNAATGEFGDMIEAGILDPTKVTRLALQNAASVAGLLLTTEVMIAEAPKDEAEHGHGSLRAAAWAAWTCNGLLTRPLLARSTLKAGRKSRPFFYWRFKGLGCGALCQPSLM